MGKRRNTAKTGDKALYKKAAQAREDNAFQKKKKKKRDDDDSDMYGDVDRFHNERDTNFMSLNPDHNDDNESDDDEGVEAVMDLGIGGVSSDEDDDDDDDGDSDSEADQVQSKQVAKIEDLDSSSSDDDDDEMEDVRDWGKKKSAYYHGDTADLELGQDEEDAFLEEEAAKEVQSARYDEMEEEDFMLSDDDIDAGKEKSKRKGKDKKADREQSSTSRISSIRNVSKMSSRDRKKLLEKQHPGLLQIVSHFSEAVKDLKDRTGVAAKALFEGNSGEAAEAVGTTSMGKKYLLTKALIQSTTALNLAMYLLLKSEEASSSNDDEVDDSNFVESSSMVQFHPVMKRLQEWNVLSQKLRSKVEDRVDGLDEQLDSLVKAAKLMEAMVSNEEEGDGASSSEEEEHIDLVRHSKDGSDGKMTIDSAVSSDEDEDDSSEDEQAATRNTMQNARYGLRPNEIAQDKISLGQKRRRRAVPSDLGDDDDAVADGKGAAKYLSSAINTIEQRAASKKKKNRISSSEELVGHKEPDEDLRRGLEMMEAELGKASDNEWDEAVNVRDEDGIPHDKEEEDGFYSTMTKKSKAKKAFKNSLYKVAPKYPRLEGEVEGERAISRAIMKNRGLVPHKNKLNRNPRVKKREQYRKALIRRKGAVREIRKDEGHKYGGEETGVKKNISRSRKLGQV